MLNAIILVTALLTGCDDADHCSYVVAFPNQPMTIRAGDEAFVLRQIYAFSLPETTRCTEARTFIGLDDGDQGEFDIELRTHSGYHILERSYHRHVNASFNSWWPHYIDVTSKDFEVAVLGRAGKNVVSGKLSSRLHVGLKLNCDKPKQ